VLAVTDDAVDFGGWVAPHLAVMANLAARLAGAADRDDVVQEALTRAWRRWSTYDPARGTPRVWLLAIVADQAGRTRRRRRPSVDVVAGVVAPVERDVDLERALARLTRRQRLAVDLHYFVGLDMAETAQVMGCAVGTVKSTLSDARERLRRLLEEP
jgi:DNA-directed RNA polymerase specialized sigma24 family protein